MKYVDPEAVENLIRVAGIYFGCPQISLSDIRHRQDAELNHSLYREAMEFFKSYPLNKLDGQSFYAGSVDFMVKKGDQPKDNSYYILETNGGSSRGFAVLPDEGWEASVAGYLEALSDCGDDQPFVLIGHPSSDLILYEKMILAESYSKMMKDTSRGKGEIASASDFLSGTTPDAQVVIGGYDKVLPGLSLSGARARFGGKSVSVVVGDGVARRHPAIARHLLTGSLETKIVNETFHVSDDKSATYRAVQESAEALQPLGVEPIRCWTARDRSELQNACRDGLAALGQVVIKPHGGSGGSGIDVVNDMNAVGRKIDDSIAHYHEKFGKDRNPYPYTVSQLVEATPAVWEGEQHKFDVRVYVGKKADTVQPLGALVRIAVEPFTGSYTKRTFVVNLSGYGGVDTRRGLGVSNETFKLLGLTEGDFVKMYVAASTITAQIANGHSETG